MINIMIPSILAINPFIDAYFQSDFLGKLIFLGLIFLSIGTWTIIFYKAWTIHLSWKRALQFRDAFQMQKKLPLSLDSENLSLAMQSNPFFVLYSVLKKQTLDLINKNRKFSQGDENYEGGAYLSPSDVDYVESHLLTSVAKLVNQQEKNLFMLATIVSLAPFLGLLGTVWGILTTFSSLQTMAGGNTQQIVLGGLSLALATTVLGLVDAIPALIGYNFLKNKIADFEIEMEGFANDILAAVELQYRRVDL